LLPHVEKRFVAAVLVVVAVVVEVGSAGAVWKWARRVTAQLRVAALVLGCGKGEWVAPTAEEGAFLTPLGSRPLL
jgi:hypothetical protein